MEEALMRTTSLEGMDRQAGTPLALEPTMPQHYQVTTRQIMPEPTF